MKIDVIFGGQYGSEGKGQVAAVIAANEDYDCFVRVGGPNAGHTVHYGDKKVVTRHIPAGMVVKDKACGYIGPGGLIHIPTLRGEIEALGRAGYDVRHRLFVHEKAIIIDERHRDSEGGVVGPLHQRIGSTGEGVGAARITHLSRDPDLCDHAWQYEDEFRKMGVILTTGRPRAGYYLIEGTQGYGLDIVTGPWPYVTTGRVTPAGLLADAGLPVGAVRRTIAVVRTMPIRVAGNSGPLYAEMSWDHVSKVANRVVQERTTVTGKVRRVGAWNQELFEEMVLVTEPTHIALTFCDYLFGGKMRDVQGDKLDDVHMDLQQFAAMRIGSATKTIPFYWGTGPGSCVFVNSIWEDI